MIKLIFSCSLITACPESFIHIMSIWCRIWRSDLRQKSRCFTIVYITVEQLFYGSRFSTLDDTIRVENHRLLWRNTTTLDGSTARILWGCLKIGQVNRRQRQTIRSIHMSLMLSKRSYRIVINFNFHLFAAFDSHVVNYSWSFPLNRVYLSRLACFVSIIGFNYLRGKLLRRRVHCFTKPRVLIIWTSRIECLKQFLILLLYFCEAVLFHLISP